jgi:hypothetical protein
LAAARKHGWLAFGCRCPTFGSETPSREAEAVSEAFFFWYVFPLLVAAGIFGWLAYDRYSRRSNRRLHPGE